MSYSHTNGNATNAKALADGSAVSLANATAGGSPTKQTLRMIPHPNGRPVASTLPPPNIRTVAKAKNGDRMNGRGMGGLAAAMNTSATTTSLGSDSTGSPVVPPPVVAPPSAARGVAATLPAMLPASAASSATAPRLPASASTTRRGKSSAISSRAGSNSDEQFHPMKAVAGRRQPLQGNRSSSSDAAVSDGVVRRAEEQMAEIQRKLSAMHADIRRLAASSPTTAPSQGPTPVTASVAMPTPLPAVASTSANAGAHTRSPVDDSGSSGGSRAPSDAGSRGGAHHLSPLPPATALATKPAAAANGRVARGVAAADSTPATTAAPAAAQNPFSLDTHGILDSPLGSSDSDDSSSSSSSDGDDNDEKTGGATGATGASAGASVSATARVGGAGDAAAAASVRQGFGFKHSEKPSGAAGGKTGGRGIHLAGGDGLCAKAPAGPAAAAAAAAAATGGRNAAVGIMQKEGGGAPAGAMTVSGVGRAAGRRLSDDAAAGNSAANDTISSVDRPQRGSSAGSGGKRRGRHFGEMPAGGGEGRDLCKGSDTAYGVDNANAADGPGREARRQSRVTRSMHDRFFAPVPRIAEVLGPKAADREAATQLMLPGAPCTWLSCIALAISCVTGVPTSIEKVLRTNSMGVHYLGLQAITLAQLYDLTNDYIHTRFHRTSSQSANCADDEFEEDEEAAQFLGDEELRMLTHVHCEMATMDTDVVDIVDEAEASHGVGEHAPVTSLAQFRKELLAHANDEKSLFMLNYDAYVIEEYETRLRANNADSEEEEAAIWAGMHHEKGGLRGAFGILVSFNSVQHTVTIVTPHITKEPLPMHAMEHDDGRQGPDGEPTSAAAMTARSRFARFAPVLANLVLEEHTVSLQTLYEALRQKDTYTQLCRGFVRVFISEDFSPKVPSIFPLFVLDGSSAGGLMTATLDVAIAPHVLGLAMTHHLAITFLLSDSARRKQSSRNLLSKANVCDVKLRGIPLTKICQQLRLPLSMIVGQSNKDSIALAFAWYTTFLQQLQVNSEVRLGLVRPYRRGGAEDGQPSITEEQFLSHLRVVVTTQSVMLISFDINIAQNVRINNSPEPAHFGIVIGLDEERGLVRIADVNVKRFRKTWHIPFYRLYNAVMGYGYMVAARDKKTVKALGGKADQEQVLKCGRYALPPLTSNAVVRFEYPNKSYAITVLADAVTRLGLSADVEKFLNFSGYHITYFLSSHLPLEGAVAVMQNYSHYALDDAIFVTATHYDYTAYTEPPLERKNDDASAADTAAQGSARKRQSHPVRTEADLLAEIQHALASRSTRQLIVKYDPAVLASDTRVFNGSTRGGAYGIIVDYESLTNQVIVNNCDPEVFYRTFSVPLPLFFRAVGSWDEEDMRARGTMLITTEKSQEAQYENTKGYDFAHALVHHPFRPVFSASCACLALAATELMLNIEAPMLLNGAPLAVEDEEMRKYKRYNNIFSAEDILYALPTFSVYDWLRQGAASHVKSVATMANEAFHRLRLPLEAVEVATAGCEVTGEHADALRDPSAFLRACSGVSGLLTITLVMFDTDAMYGVPGTSVGLVNRVEVFDDDDTENDTDTAAPPGSGRAMGSKGTVQLLEGEACRWGTVAERTAEEMMPMVLSIICVREVVEE